MSQENFGLLKIMDSALDCKDSNRKTITSLIFFAMRLVRLPLTLALLTLSLLNIPSYAKNYSSSSQLKSVSDAGLNFEANAAVPNLEATQIDWPTYGYDARRTGYNPQENTLSVSNVGSLRELWTFELNGVTNTQPIYASGVNVNGVSTSIVYVGDEQGFLYAVNAATGKQIWSQNLGVQQTKCDDLPGGVFGVTSTPSLDRATNRLYASGGNGDVYALDMSTGKIASGWPVPLVNPSLEHVYGAINIFNGKLYAAAASYCDLGKYKGRVLAVDTATARVTEQFIPTGEPGPAGGGIWGMAGVSIDAGNVYAAVGNAKFIPENYRYANHVVRLDSSLNVISSNYPNESFIGVLPLDLDFGATPLLLQSTSCPKPLLAVQNKSGTLYLYDQDNIQSGPLQKLQLANIFKAPEGQFIGIPAFSPATNFVYVSNPSDSTLGTYKHGMVALEVQNNCRLKLAWQSTMGPNAQAPYSPPTVANGVVYQADGVGSTVRAYNASNGNLLWSTTFPGTHPVFAAPTVVNGNLYIGAWDKKLHAFGL